MTRTSYCLHKYHHQQLTESTTLTNIAVTVAIVIEVEAFTTNHMLGSYLLAIVIGFKASLPS